MDYVTGLPAAEFADLLIRLREERVEGYPPSGVAGVFEGGADLHASQCDTGGDRRAAGRVPAHCLAGHRGHDRGDRPGPEGHAAHRGGCARGLRLSCWTAPSSPAGVVARSPRTMVAVSTRRPA